MITKEWISARFDNDGYDNNPDIIAIFKNEYGWMVERVGVQKAIKEWLLGLPSCLDIPYTYYDIAHELHNEPNNLHFDADYQDAIYWSQIAKIISKDY